MTDTTTTSAPDRAEAATSTSPLEPGDPRALFAKAVATGTAVIAAVRPEDLDRPTICDDLDVRQLLGHLVGVLHRVARLGRGEDPFAAGDAEAADDGWPAAWATAAHEVQAAWTDDAVLTTPMSLPWQQGTGAEILSGYLSELTVHTWDVAAATGQRPAWDDEVVATALAQRSGLPGTGRRALFEQISAQMGLPEPAYPFADAVPVPEDAPLIDQLVAWNGRQPSWRPAGDSGHTSGRAVAER